MRARIGHVALLTGAVLAGASAAVAVQEAFEDDGGARPRPGVAADAPGRVVLAGDCRVATPRPARVTLTCADAGVVAEHVRWSSWGGRDAVGSAVALAHECDPDCASSNTYRSYRVVLVASARERCADGRWRYTRLGYSWPAGSPFPSDAPGSSRPYVNLPCPS